MGISQWVQLALNAAAAAVLLNAGIAKTVAPHHLELALAEILPTLRGRLADGRLRAGLRGIAVVEIAVAGSLLTTATRITGAFATTALGLCFALLGAVGLRRGSSTPCGCLGSSSKHPLGWPNIGLGLALAAVGPLDLLTGDAASTTQYATGAVLLTAIGSVTLCLWAHRRLVFRLLAPRHAATTGSEVH
jgi:hypothetical protein